jgi:para-aminobenzoate synthetase component 1
MESSAFMTSASAETRDLMDRWGREAAPFFFLFDYELKKPVVLPLSETAGQGILFDFGGVRNFDAKPPLSASARFEPDFPDFASYETAFRMIQSAEIRGDSYLANLTFPTRLGTDLTLADFFHRSEASFRILFRDEFTVFSPETFVEIHDNVIRTFPMKGTRRIGADESDARRDLFADAKENAEHITVVDLLRNDLSLVAANTRVEHFKVLTKVKARGGDLLQMHSVIAADLEPDWPSRIGTMVTSLLPAGSVTGAPKRRTCEIIRSAETGPRGYYTGVAGIFDGMTLHSAVLIRFVEKTPTGLVYRSGGGITVYSDVRSEYDELKDKVYAPFG